MTGLRKCLWRWPLRVFPTFFEAVRNYVNPLINPCFSCTLRLKRSELVLTLSKGNGTLKRDWFPPKGWQVETYWCWKYFWIKYFAFNPWLSFSFFLYHFFLATQLKLTIETLEQGMKYVQSWQSRHKVDVIGVVLVSL